MPDLLHRVKVTFQLKCNACNTPLEAPSSGSRDRDTEVTFYVDPCTVCLAVAHN